LALHDPVPDAKTIWLYREQLARAGAVERLFARLDELLRAKGWLAMGGQIVDVTVIEARRPRLIQAEKDTIKGGGIPAEWQPSRRSQIDRDGRWSAFFQRRRNFGFLAASPEHVSRLAWNIAAPVGCRKPVIAATRGYCFPRRDRGVPPEAQTTICLTGKTAAPTPLAWVQGSVWRMKRGPDHSQASASA
jgi:IS5 family transposase